MQYKLWKNAYFYTRMMLMAENTEENVQIDDNLVEYSTTDQGFAAFLATRKDFMFMGAIDTGEPMGTGMYGNKKAFMFLVPKGTDIKQLAVSFNLGSEDTKVPFIVAVSKMRLMRQVCRKPFNLGVQTDGKKDA